MKNYFILPNRIVEAPRWLFFNLNIKQIGRIASTAHLKVLMIIIAREFQCVKKYTKFSHVNSMKRHINSNQIKR